MQFLKSIFILIIFLVFIMPAVAISQTSENVNLVGQWAHGPCYAVSAKDNYAFIGNGASFQVLNISDPSTPQLLGEVNLPELILNIAIEGNYAYVAVGNSGLRIIDISNISNPIIVGSFIPATFTEDVVADLSYAYVAAGDSGLIILNITNPSNPVQVGYYDVPDQARCVSLSNGYAYVSNGWSVRIINVSNPVNPSEEGIINLMIRDVEVIENYAYMVTGFFPDLRIFNIANPANPVEVGSIATPGEAKGLSVCGNFVYVADEQFGLRIIDVSNPSNPSEAGYYDTPGEALAVTFHGAYVFVADRGSGLRIVKPINPSVEGSYDTPDTSQDIAISEMYAYVADYTAGLRILNISNPSSPNEVGYIITRDRAEGVAFREGFAYIADGDSGLYIVDVSNPASPSEAGFLSTPGWSYDVAVSGSYAYIADGHSGLRIIDISNPYSPSEIGSYDTPSMAVGLAVEGNYAYVADDLYGLRIIDVLNPANPFEAGYYHPPGFEPSNVAVRGEHAYVTHLTGFSIINITNPSDPYREGFYDAIYEPMDVTLDGMYAYVCGDGFHIINILDPSNPITAGEFDFSNWPLGIKVRENYAYLASGSSGLSIMKIIDANEEGYYNTADEALNVAVSGDYAFVADDDAGLRIINITNPADPSETSYYMMPDKAFGITIDDTYAYVAASSSGLRIIDISNPNIPSEVGSYDTPGYSYDIAISGNYAYVADMGSGLRIINISNPFAPIEVGFFLTSHGAHGVSVDENYAYVADSDGLYIINISNPSNPSEIGYYNTPSYAYDVVKSDDYAYVADSHGMCVVNVSNPSNPVEEAYLVTPGSATDIVLNGNYVCIADGYGGGLRLIDISDPASPIEEGYYDTNGEAKGVALNGGYIYVADYDDGIYILQEIIAPSQPENLTASGSSPSPWQNTPSFELNWVNPGDLSGISQAKYKFDTTPTSNDDFSGVLSGTPPQGVTVSQQGAQILYSWLVDSAGNEDYNNVSSVILRYDNSISLPTSFSESHGVLSNTWHNITNNPTFNWTAPSDISGIAKYYVYFGTNPAGDIATDSTVNTSYTTTATQGVSYLRIQTKDNAGNIGEWLTGFIFRFDNTPPSPPTLAIEQNGTVSEIWQKDIATPTFSWSGAGDNISDIANYWVYFGILANGYPAIEVPSAAYNASLSMNDTYYLRIKSEDLAGNLSTTATLFIFKHDDQAPVNPNPETFSDITGRSQNNVWQNESNDPNFVWGVGSDALSGVHGYYYYWGREPNGTSLNMENFRTTTNYNPAPVDTGINYFRVVTKDSVDKLAASWTTGYIFKFDNIPPQETKAVSTDTSASETFTVSWSEGTDSGGAGLAAYKVRVREGAGGWQTWLTDTSSISEVYSGEHGVTYFFEAAAIDSAGNEEEYTAVAECSTVVDTFAIDNVAPESPEDLTASNDNPSPWQMIPEFELKWNNPPDMTNIAKAYYKLDEVPTSNIDTTGSLSPTPPDTVIATRESGQDLYLWLVDGRGNVDYLNHAVITLRFDQTKPQGTIASSPDTSSTDSFTVSWLGGTDSGGSGLAGYDVKVRDGTGNWESWLSDNSSTSEIYTGESGHTYFFEATAKDNAGNIEDSSDTSVCSTYVEQRLTVSLTQFLDEQSDSVLIEYNISNFDSNPTNLLCEYSLDAGNTWHIATVDGDTTNIITQNYQGSIIWNSNDDTTGIDLETVKFKITPYDVDGLGIPFITQSFHLDNNDLPSILITPTQGEQKDDIEISMQLFDSENDTLSIVCEYYHQYLQDWRLATIEGDTSSLTAYDSLKILWNSSNDLPGVVGNYKLKITPFDNDLGLSDSITIWIDQIGAPVVDSLSNFTEEQSDSVKIFYFLRDEERDAIDLECSYSDNSGDSWNKATIFGTITNITWVNYAGSLTWLSMTDLPGVDKNTVRFRITPDMNESLAKETDDFHLDNNESPKIQNIGTVDSPASGLIEIPLSITDSEGDTVHFSGLYKFTANSWVKMQDIDTLQFATNNYDDTLKWKSIDQLGFGEFDSVQVKMFPLDNDLGDSALSNLFDVYNYAGDYTGDILINGSDLIIFAQAWHAQDLNKEIGPAMGQPPLLIPDPDGKIDFEDLMVLVQQWNWSYDHPIVNKRLAKTGILQHENILWSHDQITKINKTNRNIEYILKKDSLRKEDNFTYTPVNEHLVSFEQSNYDQWLNEFGDEIKFRLDTLSTILGCFIELSYNPDHLDISDIGNNLLQENNGFTFKAKDEKQGKMIFNTIVLEEQIEPDSWADGLFLLKLAFKKDGEVPIQIDWQVFNKNGDIISGGRQNFTMSGHVAIPKTYALYQNFPNPFNPSTTIRYQLPVSGKVKLEVYNILGQKVIMLADEKQEAGYYSRVWDVSRDSHKMASGLYITRLQVRGEDGTRYSRSIKVLFIK